MSSTYTLKKSWKLIVEKQQQNNPYAMCMASVAKDGKKDSKKFDSCVKQVKSKIEEDLIPGGKADNMSLQDISNKHKVSLDELQKEFDMGMEEEKEHTPDENKRIEITLDHLMEDPKYYTKLKGANLEEEKSAIAEPETDEVVVIDPQDVTDKAQELIDQYTEEGISADDAIAEQQDDIATYENNIARLRPKLMTLSDHFNTAWTHANRSGMGGKAATSSIGMDKAPFLNFDDAMKWYKKSEDEKLEKLIDALGFVQSAIVFNKAKHSLSPRVIAGIAKEAQLYAGTARRPSQSQQKDIHNLDLNVPRTPKDTDHVSKPRTGSPFVRDDIMTSALYGHNAQTAIQLMTNIQDKLNKNESVMYDDLMEVAKLLNGPAGKLVRFILLNDQTVLNEPVVKNFSDALKVQQQISDNQTNINARNKVIDYFSKSGNEEMTEVDTLMEGWKNWKEFRKSKTK